jgi:hypothetical protein
MHASEKASGNIRNPDIIPSSHELSALLYYVTITALFGRSISSAAPHMDASFWFGVGFRMAPSSEKPAEAARQVSAPRTGTAHDRW